MADMSKKVSVEVVKRLPRYYRYLRDLADNGVIDGMASASGVTPSWALTASTGAFTYTDGEITVSFDGAEWDVE